MNKLSKLEKFGYGLGDTASNIVFQVVINFMIYFYTDVFGSALWLLIWLYFWCRAMP